jgi:glycosyltransferase involved in cell wall biosynthesis
MQRPRVLLVHNYYQQSGGEDVVFNSEKKLLQSRGHQIFEYTDTNIRLEKMNRFSAAHEMIWSGSTYSRFKKLLFETKPEVVHFHNTFILISPSAYYACKELNIPVVQTLHNYRLFCVNALFFRDGVVCEKCLTLSAPIWGVLYKCYRDSRSQSAAVATMLAYHGLLRTWQEKVDCYIALTKFARQKFIQGGLPPNKIVIKPNFVANLPNFIPSSLGNFVLFVGRIAPEKGIVTLLNAWKTLPIPLKIAGDGPLREVIQGTVANSSFIDYIGHLKHDAIIDLFKQARFVVFPSEWFESFPIVIVESFACGLPVIASSLGAGSELIRSGETGLLFNPGDPVDLAAKVQWLWDHSEESERMGRNARREYEQKYTPERNYQMLMDIYSRVIENRKKQ